MLNRAKCKLCNTIVESFHSTHLVLCNCGEIFVDGGDSLRCGAKDWVNFVRIDDDGNEIIVTVQDGVKPLYNDKPSCEEQIKMLEEMIKSYENLPQNALYSPITHYDLMSALILIHSILRSKT